MRFSHSVSGRLKSPRSQTAEFVWLTNVKVSGLPGAKVRRGIKHSSDPSQMYLTTIGLPTTIPVHLNRLLGGVGARNDITTLALYGQGSETGTRQLTDKTTHRHTF